MCIGNVDFRGCSYSVLLHEHLDGHIGTTLFYRSCYGGLPFLHQ